MYRHIKLLFLLLIISFFALNATSRPHIVNIYKERYRAENKNWSIGQDSLGTFYFANDAGLLEFDGVEWKLNVLTYSQVIRSIAVFSHQTIFSGSYEDFGRWDRDISGKLVYTSLSKELESSALRNNNFWRIWIVGDLVYFQSFSSIFVYDQTSVKQLLFDGALLLLSKVRGTFYAQQMQGALTLLQNNKFTSIKGSEVFNGTDARVILPYSTNKVLIGTNSKGFYIYDNSTFQKWNQQLSELISSKDLNCGILTSRGTYVFGTIVDGIYEVDLNGNIINHISTANGLQNNTILSLYEDELKNIWVGLDKGIACIQYNDNLSYYTRSMGSIGAVYAAVLWDNKLFVGTNQGVYYINKEKLSSFDVLSNFKLLEGTQGQVWSFKIIDEKLYCSHNNGLKEIHKDLRVSNVFTKSGVFGLSKSVIGDKEVLLLSTYTNLSLIDIKTKETHIINDISEPIINAEVDHLNNVWLEHENRGVYRVRLGDDMHSLTKSSYYGGNSGDDLPYKIKMFKLGGRIILYGNDSFYTYDDIADKIIPNSLLNDGFKYIRDIKRIIPIKGTLFWALTKNAIYKFKYDGYQFDIMERYELGLNLSLVNSYENISILNDSLSLICLDNGFSLYHDSKASKNNRKVNIEKPYLESFQATNSKGFSLYKNVLNKSDIPFSFNTITLVFSANHVFTSNLTFQYKLESVDEDWSLPQKVNQISYARLPAGTYTFMLRTVDDMGNHSEVLAYQFEILPPWYKTIWAYIFYLSFVLVVGYVAWKLIKRRFRNIHIQRIRNIETKRLKVLTAELQNKVEQKNAELLTQTTFIIQKNELILKIKEIVEEFYEKNKIQSIAPLYHKITALLNNNLNTDEDWKTFLFSFEQKHAGFFKKMKSEYPELTNTDLRLCACLKLNLDTKDIASLMNLSVRAVENNRYRLRKKFNLEPDQRLNEFLLKY